MLTFGNASIMDDASRDLLKAFLTFRHSQSRLLESFNQQYAGCSRTPDGMPLPLRRFPFLCIVALYTQWEDPEMGADVATAARRYLGLSVPAAEVLHMRVSCCRSFLTLSSKFFVRDDGACLWADSSCYWTVVRRLRGLHLQDD